MNAFRLLADPLHVLAIIILLHKIWKTKSCAGISGKSQILFAIVFTTRYLDLATVFVSVYNTIMKVVFLTASYGTVYLIYMKFKKTYDDSHDTFCIEFLVLPAIALALLINHAFDVFEILWTFSIYLESVAILPQMFLICKTGESEVTLYYLFSLGAYRALYELNWIYRYNVENYYDPISIVAGIVQTAIYILFFFYFYVIKGHCSKTQSKENPTKGKDEQASEISKPQEKLIAELDYEACRALSGETQLKVKIVEGKDKDEQTTRTSKLQDQLIANLECEV